MNPLLWIERGILGASSLLVPAKERAEWLREWRSELWHANEKIAPKERALLRFCLGSFPDALCLRRMAWARRERIELFAGSAWRCLVVLATILAVSYGLCLMLPGVRAARHVSQYRVNSGLILIQDAAANDESAATIPLDMYMRW